MTDITITCTGLGLVLDSTNEKTKKVKNILVKGNVAEKKAKRANRNILFKNAVLVTMLEADDSAAVVCSKLLFLFIRKERRFNLEVSPIFHFVTAQCVFAATDLRKGIERRKLHATDWMEHVENLHYLFYLMKNLEQKAYMDALPRLANLIVHLLGIFSDFANKLETESGEAVTNFDWIKSVMETEEKALAAITQFTDILSVIPSVSSFSATRILGAGGFGTVYKALFGGLVSCTLKLVKKERIQDGKYACAERVIACICSHPFIVNYYCTFASTTAFISVMEYVRGIDANRILSKQNGLPMDVTQLVIAQLSMAIQYLHFNGFIHRDIKPSNVIIIPGCLIKLIDFDTAKICLGRYRQQKLNIFTRRSIFEFNDKDQIGTPQYYAPELIAEKPYGRSIDWWGIGLCAYALHYAKLPFRNKSRNKLFKEILECQLPVFPDIQPKFHQFLTDTINKNPARRLCSKGYHEMQLHPFFCGIQWTQLEQGSCTIHYPGLYYHMKNVRGCYSPNVPKIPSSRCVLKLREMVDTLDQLRLYTVVSNGFLSLVDLMLKGHTKIPPGILIRPLEAVILEEPPAAEDPYLIVECETPSSSSWSE